MHTSLVVLFALIVLYTLFARWLNNWSITMPVVFVLGGAILGPSALGWLTFDLTTQTIEILTELTLALLLFADAATLEYHKIKDDVKMPGRLLGIGMPLTVVLGAGIAFLIFPSEGSGFALLIAAILAPTDAALGLPIFTNPRVPVRIRRALNVESGLNDGIATPLVTLFISLWLEELGLQQGNWLISAASAILIGAIVGIGLGLIGGWGFRQAVEKGLTTGIGRQIGNPALAMLTFFIAKGLGGNGFIAAFLAGLLFGYISRHELEDATEYTETTGTLLSVLVWVVFGASLVIPMIQNFNPLAFIYALLSLTVIRMLPVAISMLGKRLRWDTIMMMGWLGPRGLASVVFMLMAFEATHEAQAPADLLLSITGWTIGLSVLLHGVSALPLANWYARRIKDLAPDAPEMVEVEELVATRRKPRSIWFFN